MNSLFRDKPCPHCGRYANRGLSIDALIVRNQTILLIKRGVEPFKDYWALPGGYVDWDEDLETAVTREVGEEVGLTVTRVEQLGIYSRPDRHPEQVIDVAFIVEVTGEPVASDDAQAYKWANLGDLPELAFDHAQIIQDYNNRVQT